MKIMIKAKDLLDKLNLQKNLSKRLKKPVEALVKKNATELPFCYEVDFFSEGKGLLCIGETKEVLKHFKMERAKGNGGKDKNGKTIKLDKKKVAYGVVSINKEGKFEFRVQGGIMKQLQAKAIIKSFDVLKKNIGENFVITKGDAPKEESTEDKNVSTDKTTNSDNASTDKTATTENKSEGKSSSAKESAQKIGALIKSISKEMKGGVLQNIVKKIKSKKVSAEDALNTDQITAQIETLKELYESAEDKVQKHLKDHYAKVMKSSGQVGKIKNAIEKLLNTDLDGDNTVGDGDADKDKRFKEAQKYFKKFQKEMKGLQKDISKMAKSPILGGKELISSLF